MTKLRLPKYTQAFTDRHGKARFYFKRPGFSVPLPGPAYSTPFMDAYKAAHDGWKAGQAAKATNIGLTRSPPGTFAALIASYYQSPEFQNLKPITQSTYRNLLEKIRNDHGAKRVMDLKREHVKALMAKKAATPDRANRLLKMLRLLTRHAMDINLRPDDPCSGIRKLKTGSTGYRTWTEAEIHQFLEFHPPGTRARLAMELLLHTGQRRQDIVRLGRQHLRDGFLQVRQSKTGALVQIPLTREFRMVIEAIPKTQLTFIVGTNGKPLTAESFTNWFRDCVREAGLPVGLSAHGLRKAVCRRLAEAGCSANEIMAISGHTNLKEVATYTAAADRARLAQAAMDTLSAAARRR